MVLTEFARPKVNLTLKVLGRRADGYHELESLVVFASGIADTLTLTPGAPVEVRVSGPFAAAIIGQNLVERALDRLGAIEPRLVLGSIDLQKNVPVGAGLGGGSSDAAAVLRLARRANPDLAETVDWHAVAAGLGADVPVCLDDRAALVRGIGENLTPLPELPRLPAVLVNALSEVPAAKTAEVFRRLGAPLLDHEPSGRSEPMPGEQSADDPSLQSVPESRGSAAAIRDLPRSTVGTGSPPARPRHSALSRPGRGRSSGKGVPNEPGTPPFRNPAALIDYLQRQDNDLTAPAQALMPAIESVLDELARAPAPGTRVARLSGAGPTAFGIYDSGIAALTAARAVAARRPGWWVQTVWLG
jgi:4-diphosphocytidyl-2-C-methyl-D-erythritol kinase